MKNVNLKPLLFILMGFSALVWFYFARTDQLNMNNFIEFLRPISNVVAIDSIFIGFFVKWGWRWKLLQGWLVPFPDLNGTWQGLLQTNWRDTDGKSPDPIPVMLTIKQTFCQISCVLRTAEMESQSYIGGFCIDREAQARKLCYTYTSKPKVTLRDRSTPHDGTILLNIIGTPVNKLEGEYWTQRKTAGTVTLTYKMRKLLDEIPEDFSAHPMTAASKELQS